MERCPWCGTDEQYQHYHDTVWGRPEYDSLELFKKLCLDGQQAGLSWLTILRKQANYEQAFFQFDPAKMAEIDQDGVELLMQNTGIVRNRLKINSLIGNARAYLAFEQAEGDFGRFIWSFVGGSAKVNRWAVIDDVPAQTPESIAMSKALKKMGFSFVGPTICYAFMQAAGLVNDHLLTCPAYGLPSVP